MNIPTVYEIALLCAKTMRNDQKECGTTRVLGIHGDRVHIKYECISEVAPLSSWTVNERDGVVYHYDITYKVDGITFLALMSEEEVKEFYEQLALETVGSA